MQHKIIYSSNAQKDIEDIFVNITEFTSVFSAINVLNDVKASIELLGFMPQMSVEGYIKGTREIYSRKYRVVYEIDDEKSEIIILTILHTRRLYPPLA